MQLANLFLWSNLHSRIFYFSTLWTIFEFLRSILFTGFPWNLIGYSWSWSLEYSQIVSVIGIYGLGLITVFCSTCIVSPIIDRKFKFFFLSAILILLTIFIFGNYRLKNNIINFTNIDLRIVHTYFDQNEKWLINSFNQTASMGSKDFITIFPETSLIESDKWPKNWLYGYIRTNGNEYYNSINYMNYTYDKKLLVPFGEYFPLSRSLSKFLPENLFFLNSLSKGENKKIFYPEITPLICYEIIFPSYVRKNINEQTNLLVNVSNDAWFGEFSGPKQHFVHSRFRSIELGIPMVRSSNKGVSGLISSTGEIVHQINSQESAFLDVKIPKKLDSTFFRIYGNLLVYFLIVLFFIIGYAINRLK